ncbi:conserved hypothetical protein [Leishmania infantum JPCM5]|uniref:RPGR-interacting protein 1 first C2 domain-containing protein n=2 Tax=Leishmania infantum TaxID=5671 RepID=A4I0I1_LEIIN|nr:conserved hypothetical protein [Leishmania infantum JPCM5]CAC9490013.1 Protein_of_uncharacterised_function_(DUF3250)_-_putative [Leishmania infantum]CAM68251.1 conserved hypothetical protein [Leishmania infantum JPCM5]SUZ42027.1 Protein_of_uncharacterised_function_(DUF3250)_-_putative [Leishmania infantum]|eukprot:XP_001465822.1 conserved hypothetical protein [Leishmania infantum JPCM5]
MAHSAAATRSARPPGTDWQDSYFTLEERYRRLQKRFNAQEQELKLIKVAQRKKKALSAGPSLSSVSARRPLQPALRPEPRYTEESQGNVEVSGSSSPRRFPNPQNGDSGGAPAHTSLGISALPNQWVDYHISRADSITDSQQPSPPPPQAASYAQPSSSPNQPPAQQQPQPHGVEEYIAVPSAAAPQATRAAAIAEASAWGEAGALPDLAMVWGTDGRSSMQNYVVASALYHANEELRRKLNESVMTLQTLQQELGSSRAQHAALQTRLENVSAQLHQVVRERDLSAQKYTNASHTIADLERTLRDRVSEEEKIRFSLESQITELRSRLVVGADSNELLQKDVRSLLSETRDRTAEVMKLRSNLALAESALSSQRHVNENMLVELKSLSTQLVEERKRLITVTREAHLASLSGTRVEDLEQQLQRVQEERNAIEREHIELMSDFVHITEDALRHAREEVGRDVADWKAAATHWEQVSQLLYKDIAERTQQHLQCRAECEEAQGQRDAAELQLRSLKGEVALLTAKLDVVWPSHATDAKTLTAEEILNVFGRKDRAGIFLFDERCRRRAAALRRSGAYDGEPTGASATGETAAAAEENDGGGEEDAGFDLAAAVLGDLPADPTTVACQLQELHEANAALISEVHQLRLTNDLLQERLNRLTGRQKEEQARVAAAEVSLQQRERAGHQLLEKQLDRVAFLEAQVRSLRGYHVPANAPIGEVGENENIFELYLGQLVAAEAPEGIEVPEMFSTVFCSADFLVHETVTTGTVRGFNGFFEVTASFCVSMDALLFYYLHTRQLLIQLHRVRNAEEAAAMTLAAAAGAGDEETHLSVTDAVDTGTTHSAHGGSSSGSTHPSLRMAEHMFETIAEGQVSLADIVLREDCRHSTRPTLKGHVHLVTPAGRHLASVEFRLTARRPYSADFVRLVEKSVATAITEGAAAAAGKEAGDEHDASSHLLDWMRATASTSLGAAEHRRQESGQGTTPTPRHTRSAAKITPTDPHLQTRHNQLQLVPVASADGDTSSTASSFLIQQQSRMAGTAGALVVHLPPPSPPPRQRWPSASSWGRREGSDLQAARHRGGGSPFSSRADHDSVMERSPVSASFMHVDRSLLSAQPVFGGSGGEGSRVMGSAIQCLWVDVERVELPADLPPPIPRLSCYFRVEAADAEVWLDAPPTPRYTWEYTLDVRDGRAGAYGASLPVRSVTQLASILREPLVVFLLDADAMASKSAAAVTDPCVWAMAVCEWAQVVQHPNEPQSFALPLLRRDQSVVHGAVLRLSLTASTIGVRSSPPHAEPSPSQLQNTGLNTSSSPFIPPPPMSSPPPPPPPPPPPLPEELSPPRDLSMEEELLRLEYKQHTGRSFV